MRFRANLTAQILSGVVIVLAVLCGVVSFIGYSEFTEALELQYESKSFNMARTAATYITPGFLSATDRMSANWRFRYDIIQKEWQRLADTQDATFIYLYRRLDEEYNTYDRFEVLISVMNASAPYMVFSSGIIINDMPDVYEPAYSSLYEDGADRAVVPVYRDEFSEDEYKSGDHITVLLPIRDSQGRVLAVLGVEQQMKALQNARSTYVRHVFLATGVFLIVVLLGYGLYLKHGLLNPIRRIAEEAQRFARENTRPFVPLSQSIRLSNEIGQLAQTIDRMETDIRSYIEDLTRATREKEQIKAELHVARKIQADMLPREFPPFPDRKEFEIFATMTPAKEVGGDFYDFFFTDRDHLALVIADVSGKGVPAALFMVIAKTLIKDRAQMGGTPSEILDAVNNRLCDGNSEGFFVTVWLGILEVSTGKLTSANAGHEYPVIKRAGGMWELIKDNHSPAVAVRSGLKFRENSLELRPGDSLYLYTDGVAEATNAENDLYGTDNMTAALNRHPDEPMEELLVSMKREVDTFVGDAPQFDDITMMGLQYWGQ
ncbi:MAG: SpoIIE family protein phosphatase [Fretibacterium sp.]|nr:SpoIIE family protein phosphatase [Fretibacterium sp.]